MPERLERKETLPINPELLFSTDPDRQKRISELFGSVYDFKPTIPSNSHRERDWKQDVDFAKQLVASYSGMRVDALGDNPSISALADVFRKAREADCDRDEAALRGVGLWNDSSALAALVRDNPDAIKYARFEEIVRLAWQNEFDFHASDYLPAFYSASRQTIAREHEVSVGRELPSDWLPVSRYRGRGLRIMREFFCASVVKSNKRVLEEAGYGDEKLEAFLRASSLFTELNYLTINKKIRAVAPAVTQSILDKAGISRNEYDYISTFLNGVAQQKRRDLEKEFLKVMGEKHLTEHEISGFDDADGLKVFSFLFGKPE